MKMHPQIWNKLVNKRGKIKKVTGDYATRMGVTQEPLADVEFYGELITSLINVTTRVKCSISLDFDKIPPKYRNIRAKCPTKIILGNVMICVPTIS
jgi:hypothetical protein